MQAGERDRLERPGRYALRPIAEERLRFDSDYHEGLAQRHSMADGRRT
jgi:hypothetical protein